MPKICKSCNAINAEDAVFCTTCGAMPLDEPFPISGSYSGQNPHHSSELVKPQLPPPPSYLSDVSPGYQSGYRPGYQSGRIDQLQPVNVVIVNQGKSKGTAALLAFFLGGLGIHRFYLGHAGIGIAQLLLLLGGFLTCGVTSIAAGLWAFIDFILILTGSISKDAQGNPLV